MSMAPGNDDAKVDDTPSVPLEIDEAAHQPSDTAATVETSEGAASKRPRDDEEGEIVEDETTETPPEKRSRTEAEELQVKPDDSNNDDKQPPQAQSQASESARAPPVSSMVITRSRTSEKSSEKMQEKESVDTAASKPLSSVGKESWAVKEEEEEEKKGPRIQGRWRVHQMAEDYVGLVGQMMYPATRLRPYGFDSDKREYPLEGISVLGYLKSSLRRPTVIEKWSPYEIALFEGALLHHGKEFHLVSRVIGSKSTKEVIDFYYIWKKTKHYKKWKSQFVPDSELLELDSPVKGAKT